jgi:hypothetical protein
MRVVVFEDIGADRVQKSGIERVGPIAAPDHDPLRRPEKRVQHIDCDAYSLVLRATERTADKVQETVIGLLRAGGAPYCSNFGLIRFSNENVRSQCSWLISLRSTTTMSCSDLLVRYPSRASSAHCL